MTDIAQPATNDALDAAKNLDRRQFRRYIEALEVESALTRGDQPPSALGRWFKPAETERKLVLFTLGIIVVLLIVSVFVIEMWSDSADNTAITTSLVTLAGTGLGFIGGMVSDRRRSDRDTQGGGETFPGAAPDDVAVAQDSEESSATSSDTGR